MTAQGAVLLLALLCLAIGVLRDIARSEQGTGLQGPLGGTLRPQSWAGFSRGLPCFVVGALLVAVVAWGRW